MEKRNYIFEKGIFSYYCFMDGTKSHLLFKTWNSAYLFFDYFSILFESKEGVLYRMEILDNIKSGLSEESDYLGQEDMVVKVNSKEVFFDLLFDYTDMFPCGFFPFIVDFEVFYSFMTEAVSCYLKYESGEIPGLIPESKLNTWSCVPNEYIKPEYWDLLKQQQEQKDNEI